MRLSKKQKELQNRPSLLKLLPPEIIAELQEGLYAGKPLVGKEGLLAPMIKELIELSLQGEMDAHLSEINLEEASNRRNGITTKNVKSSVGNFDLDVPRDRNSSFEPEIVRKRQTVLNQELDNKILSLYALGNSYEDISKHISDIYAIDVSDAKISAITDKLIPTLTEWRNRPLSKAYAIVFLDAMFFKVKQDNKVQNKAIYNIMGIDMLGKKDILGFYGCESEGSHFWLGVLNDLKSRGIEDILISCIDGLKGFPEAINTAFPKTEIQTCIVHQIRNSLKYVASKNSKEFMQDLKGVYQADTKDMAEYNLLTLEEKWGNKYPMVIKSWQNNWSNLSTYFKFSKEIRTLIYTTNPIEGFHRQVRKYTKTKGSFTSENALYKLLFCAIKQVTEKWTMPIPNWGMTISQLDVYFPNRVNFRD
jgi:transposase-like protein